jgi:hypothetical protein
VVDLKELRRLAEAYQEEIARNGPKEVTLPGGMVVKQFDIHVEWPARRAYERACGVTTVIELIDAIEALEGEKG